MSEMKPYYQKDNQTIILGDCLEVMKTFPDKSFDLVLTDPPYQFTTGGGLVGEDRDYVDELRDLNCLDFEPHTILNAVLPKLKVFNGYFFCNKVLVVDYIQWAKEHGFLYDILVMAKSNPIPAYRGHHLSDIEYVIFIREKGSYFSQHKNNFDDFRKFYIKNSERGLHPAEKPVDLLCRYIRVSCTKDNTILDPFMGSGTTLVAAKQLGRNATGIEISEKYCEIAKNRLAQDMLF